jgi:hypothetical protein
MLVAHGIKDEETLQLTFNGNGLARGVMVSKAGLARFQMREVHIEYPRGRKESSPVRFSWKESRQGRHGE